MARPMLMDRSIGSEETMEHLEHSSTDTLPRTIFLWTVLYAAVFCGVVYFMMFR